MVVRLNMSLYGLDQVSRQTYAHVTEGRLTLGFLECLADACDFQLMRDGRVVMTTVVPVGDT